RLDYVVASLALIRIAGSGMFLYFAKKQINKVEKPVEKNDGLLKELLGFGGWVTVSNILDPLLNYLDRFVIGSLLSMSAVAYFTTPFEVTTKLVVIPAALIASLFPALSNLAVLAPERLKTMIGDSYHFLVAITFLICFTGIMGSELFLHYWIDEEFARESTFILQIFLLGFFVNSLAKIPFSHLQSIGKPDITAKIHLAEAPFTILFIFLGAIYYGIVGVALVRFFRVLVDMVLLMLFSSRFIENLKMPFKRIFFHLGVLICAVLATMLKPGLLITAGTIVLGGLIYLIYFWFASEERHKNYLGNLSSNLFG
ncbi:MAG TPA: oligosaccharide flippase family protein, partial [Balneolaceae bacterium]|nr:oligosaccharide flippase family protein [Balneolaceae bacterium]